MVQPFDPRQVLKKAAKPLLRDFFARRGELQDLPWDKLKETNDVDVIYDAWQRLPDDRRHEVHTLLQDLVALAKAPCTRAFAQDIEANNPDESWKFTACRSHLNKALWFYLQYPERYKRVALIVRADALSTGRYAVRRNGLPKKKKLKVTPELIE